MNALKKAYRAIVDHLTKVIGGVGVVVMSGIAAIEPETVTAAAQTYASYLGQHVVAKIGIAMFVLVVLRGWYTGYKSKLAAAEHARVLEENAALQARLAAAEAKLAPPPPQQAA